MTEADKVSETLSNSQIFETINNVQISNFIMNKSAEILCGNLNNIVTGSRYADCHCYPTAGYIATAAGVTEFPEICAVATQRKVITNSISVATISYS
jgi:hypothetical protein